MSKKRISAIAFIAVLLATFLTGMQFVSLSHAQNANESVPAQTAAIKASVARSEAGSYLGIIMLVIVGVLLASLPFELRNRD